MPDFVSYDGTRLAYHEKGDGDPLVCVPAIRASAYLGDLGGLSAHRRLIVLEHRGHGDSAAPADPSTYRCERLVEDVEALRAHLGLDTIDVLGHSAAGNIVALYAARYPRRVARAVLVAPNWAVTDLELPEDERVAQLRRREGEPWFAESFAAMTRLEAGEILPGDPLLFGRLLFGRWTAAAREYVETRAGQVNPEALARFGEQGAFGDPARTRADLKRLTAPVLLLGGDLDPGPTPRLLRDYAGAFPNATVAIQPEAGHNPWIDDGQAFVGTVTAFLEAR